MRSIASVSCALKGRRNKAQGKRSAALGWQSQSTPSLVRASQILPLLILLLSLFSPLHARVVLNEIHYHPHSEQGLEEFIELHNASSEAMDLSQWRMAEGIRFTFPQGTTITPRAYLVLARDPAALRAATGYEGALGPYQGKLANSGELLILEDADGTVISEVLYADTAPWPTAADGAGPSLELMHPGVTSLDTPQVWAASTEPHGTPGRANSALAQGPAPPVIRLPRHRPALPRAGEEVFVTALVEAPPGGAPRQVTLWHRRDGDAEFRQTPMRDDGRHGDDAPGDGVFGARVRGLDAGDVLDFHLRATTAEGAEAIAPVGAPEARAYLVPFGVPRNGSGDPQYVLALREADRRTLATRPVESDDLLDATFLTSAGRVAYNVGLRLRGNTARTLPTKSYRVQFRADDPFEGERLDLNLIGHEVARQWLGYDAFRRAGIPTPQTRFVALAMNAESLGTYLEVEAYSEPFLARHFPGEADGNLYRGVRGGAALFYAGEERGVYEEYYPLRTNREGADYADLVDLVRWQLDEADTDWEPLLRRHADVENWARTFALHMALDNAEGGIWNDYGDDYFLYFCPSDGRALFLPWDFDGILTGRGQSLWAAQMHPISRFLTSDAFAPRYLAEVVSLLENELSAPAMEERLQALGGHATEQEKAALRAAMDHRRQQLLSQISHRLAIHSAASYDRVPLVRPEDAWDFFPGLENPSGETTQWAQADFPATGWSRGAGGFGSWPQARTRVDPNPPPFRSLYLRRAFDAPPAIDLEGWELVLQAEYGSGLVAFLNGREVLRENMVTKFPVLTHEFGAIHYREPEGVEEFVLGPAKDLLRPGAENLLALQGFTIPWGRAPFLISAGLALRRAVPMTTRGEAQRPELELAGGVDQTRIYGLRVNGEPVEVFKVARNLWRHTLRLQPGPNPVVVEALGADGEVVETLRAEAAYRPEGTPRLATTVQPRMAYGSTLLVRAELHDGAGRPDRATWQAQARVIVRRADTGAAVSAEPATFALVNGMGSAALKLALPDQTNPTPLILRVECDGEAVERPSEALHYEFLRSRRIEWTLADDKLHWSPEQGIHVIAGFATVPAGKRLVIEPGTLVLMTAGARLNVLGSVEARGTAEAPITFAPVDPAQPWGQIMHYPTEQDDGESTYRHTLFTGGGATAPLGHCAGPAFAFTGPSLVMEDCTIAHMPGAKGLWSEHATRSVAVRRTLFSDLAMGAELMTSETLRVEDCWFTHLRSPDDSDGLYLIGEGDYQVRGSVFAHLDDDGVDTAMGRAVIEDCLFHHAGDKGLSLEGYTATVRDCLIVHCPWGIVVSPWSAPTQVTLERVTIADVRDGALWFRPNPRLDLAKYPEPPRLTVRDTVLLAPPGKPALHVEWPPVQVTREGVAVSGEGAVPAFQNGAAGKYQTREGAGWKGFGVEVR